jgi:hypothetical protein
MNALSTWLDSEPCPRCGTGLHVRDGGTSAIRQDRPACGWTAIADTTGQAGDSR